MTNEEKQEIISAVLEALATNSKTISNLTPVTELVDSDLFEVAGGKRVTFANIVASLLSSSGYAAATAAEQAEMWQVLMANFVATQENESVGGVQPQLAHWAQSRVVLLKSMGAPFDDVEASTLSVGDLIYSSQGKWIFEKLENNLGNGIHPSEGVLYINKRTGKTYLWSSDEEDMIELSSPIHVVNNLETGGEEDALSAEQGKKLGDAVFNREVTQLDYSDVDLSNVYINGTKWAVSSQGKYQGKFVNVTNYKGWAFKIGGVWIPSGNSGYWWLRFAMVTSNSFSDGGDIPFVNVAPYNAKVENSTSEWHEGVIPSIEGNIYLYIYCYNSTGTPVDFPPELYVTDPNPSSRIERLEGVTEGVPSIKQDWFAISGEDYDYSVPSTEYWNQQNIDAANGTTYTGSANAGSQKTFPKSASKSTAAATPADCYKISDLPGRKLILTFSQRADVEAGTAWSTAIALYDAAMGFLGRTSYGTAALVTDQSSPDYNKLMYVHDFSGQNSYPTAAYFKIVLSRGVSANNWTYKSGDMSFVKRPMAQESMPDRVATLEGKVEALRGGSAGKITVMSYNIGHFALGQSSNTSISDQYEDAQDYSAAHPYSNYAAQKTRWRQMLNEFSPDVLLMCEYNPVFAKNGPSKNQEVSAQEAVFGCLPYKREGTRSGYMQTAIYANLLLGTSVETVYQDYTQWRYYQCVEVNMGGVPVKLVATHLDFTDSQHGRTDRESQFAELVAAFANDDHVIICGDFNNDNASEFEAFDPDDGWVMANHGYVGDVFTYPSTGGVVKNGQQVPQYAIDNIIVKGFAMSNIRYIDRKELTDHIGVVCDLTLVD